MKNVGKREEKYTKKNTERFKSPIRIDVLYRSDSYKKLYVRQSNNQESLMVKSKS